MPTQDALHFARGHLQSADVDLILDPTRDREIALLIDAADVAGAEPALPECSRLLVRPVPVAGREMRPADAHLSVLARRDLSIVRTEDADLHPARLLARDGATRRRLLARPQKC